MKSKDDGSRGPGGPDGSVTPRYITKKSPRNVRHGVLETSLTISCVFRKIEFFDYTGIEVDLGIHVEPCRSSAMVPRVLSILFWVVQWSPAVKGQALCL